MGDTRKLRLILTISQPIFEGLRLNERLQQSSAGLRLGLALSVLEGHNFAHSRCRKGCLSEEHMYTYKLCRVVQKIFQGCTDVLVGLPQQVPNRKVCRAWRGYKTRPLVLYLFYFHSSATCLQSVMMWRVVLFSKCNNCLFKTTEFRDHHNSPTSFHLFLSWSCSESFVYILHIYVQYVYHRIRYVPQDTICTTGV